MALVNVQSDDFLKQLVQCLITMRNKQSTLSREVMVDVIDDLGCNVCFSGPRRANNDGEARLGPRRYSFCLSRGEADRIKLRGINRIGSTVWRFIGRYTKRLGNCPLLFGLISPTFL